MSYCHFAAEPPPRWARDAILSRSRIMMAVKRRRVSLRGLSAASSARCRISDDAETAHKLRASERGVLRCRFGVRPHVMFHRRCYFSAYARSRRTAASTSCHRASARRRPDYRRIEGRPNSCRRLRAGKTSPTGPERFHAVAEARRVPRRVDAALVTATFAEVPPYGTG